MGIKLLRLLNDLPQAKLDLVCGQRHALEMAFDKVAIIAGQRLAGGTCVEVIAELGKDERLELDCGNTADRSRRLGFFQQQGLRDVIAVARAALVEIGRASCRE